LNNTYLVVRFKRFLERVLTLVCIHFEQWFKATNQNLGSFVETKESSLSQQ